MWNNKKYLHNHNTVIVLLYLLLAPAALAAVKDSLYGQLDGVMLWDLLYNVLGGAGGGIIQVVRNLQNPRRYSRHIGIELSLSMVVSAFAGLLTYLFVAGTDIIAISGMTMLFLSCCAGVLGYEAIRVYTAEFNKTVSGHSRD